MVDTVLCLNNEPADSFFSDEATGAGGKNESINQTEYSQNIDS